MTQREAATASGVSERTIQRLEKHGTNDLQVLIHFSKVYRTHLVRIIFPESQHREIVHELMPDLVKNYFK